MSSRKLGRVRESNHSRSPTPLNDAHLGRYFFTAWKLFLAFSQSWSILLSFVRYYRRKRLSCCVFNSIEARSEVVAWTGFSFAWMTGSHRKHESRDASEIVLGCKGGEKWSKLPSHLKKCATLFLSDSVFTRSQPTDRKEFAEMRCAKMATDVYAGVFKLSLPVMGELCLIGSLWLSGE